MSRRLNPYQWISEDANGRAGVSAERLVGCVSIRVSNGVSYMGRDLTMEQADDLAKFIIDCGIAERAESRMEP